jgi:hypothetical protein
MHSAMSFERQTITDVKASRNVTYSSYSLKTKLFTLEWSEKPSIKAIRAIKNRAEVEQINFPYIQTNFRELSFFGKIVSFIALTLSDVGSHLNSSAYSLRRFFAESPGHDFAEKGHSVLIGQLAITCFLYQDVSVA